MTDLDLYYCRLFSKHQYLKQHEMYLPSLKTSRHMTRHDHRCYNRTEVNQISLECSGNQTM